ncbi:hypothetical protein F6X37_06585 [Paraburkholderia sp. 31.1]|nr:hypothetical protein [Paraburkholderia sp. 31.1]
MSHFLDRLRYFTAPRPQFSDGHGAVTDEDRQWEDAYRQRWQHDKIVRSMGVVTGIVGLALADSCCRSSSASCWIFSGCVPPVSCSCTGSSGFR